MTMTDSELLQTIAPVLKGIGEFPEPTYVPTNPEAGGLAAAFIRVFKAPKVRVINEETVQLMAKIAPAIVDIENSGGKVTEYDDPGGIQK